MKIGKYKSYVLLGLSLIAFNAVALDFKADSKQVDLDDFKREVGLMSAEDRARLLSHPQSVSHFISSIAKRRALVIEAEKAGLMRNDLVKNDVLIAYEQSMYRQLKSKFLDELVIPDLTDIAKERYLAEQDKYKVAEQVKARHILIPVTDSETEARSILSDIKKRLESGEVSFEQMAKEYSTDKGSSKKGGDLGYFTRGRMVKPFEEAVFSLHERGDYSDLVKTRFGLHLIQLTDKKPAYIKSFEDVSKSIISKIEFDYIQSSLETWERGIVEKYPANVDMEELGGYLNSFIGK